MNKKIIIISCLVVFGLLYYLLNNKKSEFNIADIDSWVELAKKELVENADADTQNRIKSKLDDKFMENIKESAKSTFSRKISTKEIEKLSTLLKSESDLNLLKKYSDAYFSAASLIRGKIASLGVVLPQIKKPEQLANPELQKGMPPIPQPPLPPHMAQPVPRPEFNHPKPRQSLPAGFENFRNNK